MYEGLRRAAADDGSDLLCWVRVEDERPGAVLLPGLPAGGLTDGTLTLRASRMEDADALWTSATDVETQRWSPFPPVDRTRFRARLMRVPLAWLIGEAAAMTMVADGVVVGSITVRVVAGPLGEVDLGYDVLPAHRGQGWATRALRLAASWAVGQRSVHRATASANVDNIASLRVLSRVMVREGVLRSYLPSPAGPRQDVVLCSLVASDLS